MLYLIDAEGKGHGVLAEVEETHGVNGEKSISGTIYATSDYLPEVDLGYKIIWKGETYYLIFAQPMDYAHEGNGVDFELKFDAVHEFFYLFSKSAVGYLNDGSHTMRDYLHFLFEGTGYSYKLSTNVKAFSKQSFNYKNRLDLFYDLIKTAGVEFSVNGSVVNIVERMGNDLSTVVRKGLNLNELKIEKKVGEFITKKKGYGAFFDKDDESKGRLEVEYISPLAAKYGTLEGDPVVDERYTNPEELKKRLKYEVDNSYTISVSLSMEDLVQAGYEYQQPRAGDSLMVIDEGLRFKRKVRIVSYKSYYDVRGQLVKHEVTCNSLGMVKSNGSNQSSLQAQIDQLKVNAELAKEERNKILANVSADGRHMAYYSAAAPDPKQVKLSAGDIWFDSSGEELVQWIWNGHEWRRYGFDKEAFEKRMKEVEEAAKKVADEANKAYQKADSIAGEVLGTKTLAEEAKGIADEAKKLASGVDEEIQSIKDKQEEDNQATLNILGQDGYLKYSNNRIDGAVDRKLVPDHNATVIKHNGKGFVVGKPYTLSFCVKVEKAPILPFAVGIQSHIERSM